MSSSPDSSNTRANSSRITQTSLAVPVVLIQAVEAYTSAHKIINESGRSLRHQKKDLLKLRISHGNFLKQLATILLGGNIPQEYIPEVTTGILNGNRETELERIISVAKEKNDELLCDRLNNVLEILRSITPSPVQCTESEPPSEKSRKCCVQLDSYHQTLERYISTTKQEFPSTRAPHIYEVMDNLKARYPGINPSSFAAIVDGSFNPKDIFKLMAAHPEDSPQGPGEDRETPSSDYTGGIISLIQPFEVYCQILIQLAPPGSAMDLQQNLAAYRNHLYELSKHHTFSSVLTYHLSCHALIKSQVSGVYDGKLWGTPNRAFQDVHLVKLPKPSSNKRSDAQSDGASGRKHKRVKTEV